MSARKLIRASPNVWLKLAFLLSCLGLFPSLLPHFSRFSVDSSVERMELCSLKISFVIGRMRANFIFPMMNEIFKLAPFFQCWMSFPSFITPSIIQCFSSCLKMSFIIGRMKFAFILPMMIDIFKLASFCHCWMSFPSFIKPYIINALLVVQGVFPSFLQWHLQTSFIPSMLDEFSMLH